MGQKRNNILSRSAWAVTFSFTCLYSHAAIPPQQLTLNLNAVNPIKEKAKITNEDVAALIPMNLQPGQTDKEVGLRVVDKGLNSFTQGDYFRNTEVGKAASGVEKAMKTEVHFGDPEQNEIQHSLNMQVQAFEQKAFVKYSGFTNVRLTYLMYNSNLNLEINESLGVNTELVIKHDLHDQLSQAQVKWSW
jgi:hypothetical protein